MTMKALGLAEKIPEGGGSRAIPHIIEADITVKFVTTGWLPRIFNFLFFRR